MYMPYAFSQVSVQVSFGQPLFEKTDHAIHWIVIYPVDSIIHLSQGGSGTLKIKTV